MNKSMLRTLVALLGLALLGTAQGKEALTDALADYSHAMPLAVSGKQAVVQLRLPRDVYLHARTADLRDVRVFDAAGSLVPFALQQAAVRAEKSRRDLPVRVFAVKTDRAAGGTLDADLEVRRSADGAVLSVSARSRPANQSGATLDTLVLDLGAKPPPVDALRFTLPAGMDSYQARVVLEVSDDLKQWDTVGDSAIAWLVNEQTETLASERMQFEARAFRYARLSWREGKPLRFAAIHAEAPLDTAVAPHMDRLQIEAAPGRFPTDVVYPAAIAIPVERLGLDLGQRSTVLPVQFGRYIELPDRHGGKKTTWVFEQIAAATFYQLDQGGKRRASGDIAITPARADQWVLRMVDGPFKTPAPPLRLGWTPATMVFLANGKAPYRLAFGRADARSGERPLAQVAPGFDAGDLAALEQATAGPLQLQGAGAAAQPGAAERAAGAAHGRMLALWAALLLGVAVLGYMAWRLLKQMK